MRFGFITQKENKLQWVSFLKGIAILFIVLCHIGETYSSRSLTVYYGLSFGQMACQLFFVLSSFTLCLSFEKKQSIGDYYKKRLFRIAPPYWATIVLSVGLHLIGLCFGYSKYASIRTDAGAIILNVLLLHGFSQEAINSVVWGGWFIGTIAVFYLLFPLLFKMWVTISEEGKRVGLMAVLPFFCQSIICVIYLLFRAQCKPLSFLYFHFVNQLSSFLLGFLVYDLFRTRKLYSIRFPGVMFVVSLVAATAVYFGGYFLNFSLTFNLVPILFSYSYLFLIALVSQKFSDTGRTESFCEFIAGIGKHSYGIYLFHFHVIYNAVPFVQEYLYDKLKYNLVMGLIIIVLIFVPLCFLLGILFDIPFQMLNNHLRNTFES